MTSYVREMGSGLHFASVVSKVQLCPKTALPASQEDLECGVVGTVADLCDARKKHPFSLGKIDVLPVSKLSCPGY